MPTEKEHKNVQKKVIIIRVTTDKYDASWQNDRNDSWKWTREKSHKIRKKLKEQINVRDTSRDTRSRPILRKSMQRERNIFSRSNPEPPYTFGVHENRWTFSRISTSGACLSTLEPSLTISGSEGVRATSSDIGIGNRGARVEGSGINSPGIIPLYTECSPSTAAEYY